MEKTDLAKTFKAYYTAKPQPQVLEIEKACYISICGQGDPSEKEFADNLQALYSTAYTLKFMLKAASRDFVVAKLEGLWSFDEDNYRSVGIAEAPVKIPRSEWHYRMLIRMPDHVESGQLEEASSQVVAKKGIERAKHVSWFEMKEGKVVQMLHVGPFATEPVTLLKMQAFMEEKGMERNGLHHEIYLSDFRKTLPEKLKTILREPVK